VPVLSVMAYQHLFWRYYTVPVVLVVTMAVRCLFAVFNMSQNTKLLVFGQGFALDLDGELMTLPQTLIGWGEG